MVAILKFLRSPTLAISCRVYQDIFPVALPCILLIWDLPPIQGRAEFWYSKNSVFIRGIGLV